MISMQVLRLISSYLGLGNSAEGCLNSALCRMQMVYFVRLSLFRKTVT